MLGRKGGGMKNIDWSNVYKITDINCLEGEIWKAVLGYEGLYEVSSYGRIKSLISNKILKQWYGGNKQLMVCLCADGIKHKQYVHAIVGICFKGVPNRARNEVFVHLNQCKTDNRATNISIESKSSECLLTYHLGVRKDWGIKDVGRKTQFIPKYIYIGTTQKGEEISYSYDELLDKFGNGVRSIYRCINGEPHFKTAYKMTWRREKITFDL